MRHTTLDELAQRVIEAQIPLTAHTAMLEARLEDIAHIRRASWDLDYPLYSHDEWIQLDDEESAIEDELSRRRADPPTPADRP